MKLICSTFLQRPLLSSSTCLVLRRDGVGCWTNNPEEVTSGHEMSRIPSIKDDNYREIPRWSILTIKGQKTLNLLKNGGIPETAIHEVQPPREAVAAKFKGKILNLRLIPFLNSPREFNLTNTNIPRRTWRISVSRLPIRVINNSLGFAAEMEILGIDFTEGAGPRAFSRSDAPRSYLFHRTCRAPDPRPFIGASPAPSLFRRFIPFYFRSAITH